MLPGCLRFFESHEVVLLPVSDSEDGAETAGEVVIRAFIETADGTCLLIPRGVTWSPDGRYLLYRAWGTLWNPKTSPRWIRRFVRGGPSWWLFRSTRIRWW